MHWNRKRQKTGAVTRTFKLIAIAQQALELQQSTYHCYTRRKILVLMVLFIEAYHEIPFAQNRPSIEASIHISFFSVFFITPLYKNVHNSFIVHFIELY